MRAQEPPSAPSRTSMHKACAPVRRARTRTTGDTEAMLGSAHREIPSRDALEIISEAIYGGVNGQQRSRFPRVNPIPSSRHSDQAEARRVTIPLETHCARVESVFDQLLHTTDAARSITSPAGDLTDVSASVGAEWAQSATSWRRI